MIDQPNELSPEAKDKTVALFVAATSGEYNRLRTQALEDWAEQSDTHRREVERLTALTQASAQLRDSFPLPRPLPQPRPQRNRIGWWMAGATAMAAAVALWLTPPLIVRADNHRPLTVKLHDGSSVTLDAGASAEISRLPWPRRVRLTEGRALFHVTHDDFTPFLVDAGAAHLRDLGTRFLVELRTDDTHVAVFDGTVEVNGRLNLTAGQAAIASATGITALTAPDEDKAAGWSRGRLIFKDAPLSEVARLLSRYQPSPVRVDGNIAGLRVSGTFELTQQNTVLRGLEQVLPVLVRHDAAGVVITARK